MSKGDVLRDAQLETGRTIARDTTVLFTLLLVSLLLLGFPDSFLLSSTATVNVPVVGAASFKNVLLAIPVLLLAIRLHLEVFLRKEAELAERMKDARVEMVPVVTAHDHLIMKLVRDFVRYFLVPFGFAVITRKAMAFPTLGGLLLAATVFVIVLMLWLGAARGSLFKDLGLAAGVILASTVIVMNYEGIRFVRAFDLQLANLERGLLSSQDLRAARMYRANLLNADMGWTDLTDAQLVEAKLDYADLYQAKFERANLWKAQLRHAQLPNVLLKSADVSAANFSNADMQDAVIQDTTGLNTNFKDTNLQHTFFYGGDFSDASFNGADFSDTILQNIRLQRSIFDNSTLLMTRFYNVGLGGSRFEKATLSSVEFYHIEAWGISFRNAMINSTNFKEVSLLGADFRNARLGPVIGGLLLTPEDFLEATSEYNLRDFGADSKAVGLTLYDASVTFREADLRQANFARAFLQYVQFQKSDLRGARFKGADLSWTNFTNVRLEGAQLTDACGIGARGAAAYFVLSACRPPDQVTKSTIGRK